ncbi:MAG TPA: ribosome-binding factor A [Candidatus Paceibacterota bacterium]|nr:ribosome-binding factor A [Candidatus Paceibacterota bacterium]
MNTIKDERFDEIIRDMAARFIALESNRTSMITVTRVETKDRGALATVFLTVYPDSQEGAAIDFLKRQRSDFREYVKSHARLMRIPFFDFEIDKGEKARQKIDAITIRP